MQYLLKAPDASKELGRESHFIGKELDKAARADTDVIGKISDGGSGMNIAKKAQRAIDCTMPFQRLESLRQQTFFKNLKFHLRRLRLQQTLSQQSGFMSPQIFQARREGCAVHQPAF